MQRDHHDNAGDGNASCESLYATTIVVEPGGVLMTGGCPVYARSLEAAGTIDGDVIIIPDLPECPGDVTGNGTVDINDVLMVLGNYLCEGNCESDGIVDINDVLIVLSDFGGCQ